MLRFTLPVDRDKFLHFYGELGARLDRLDGALDIEKPRSWTLTLLSPFLFFMPLLYMKELERLYVDESIHYYFWRQFIAGLYRDWENSITPASSYASFLVVELLTNFRSPGYCVALCKRRVSIYQYRGCLRTH
jgi:hypothetical protein